MGMPGDVVFLLGAGASVEAGLPLLGDLTREVRDGWAGGPGPLPDQLRQVYEELRAGDLLPHERSGRNVEDVLSAADGLATSRLFHRGRGPRDFATLAHTVRSRIWLRLGGTHRLPALDRLSELVEEHGSLAIASLNNDLVLETWARRRRMVIDRGFGDDDRFEVARLARSMAPLRLAKLHGSVDWVQEAETGLRQVRGIFRTARGFVPLRTPVPDAVIVFPSRIKAIELSPPRELFVLFGRWLADARVLVVVGCRLGDPHVVEALREGCRRNPRLRILVVQPKPFEVLDRLEAVRGGGVALRERVDGLPRGFGDALMSGRLAERVRELLDGRRSPGVRLAQLASSGGVGEPGAMRELAAQVATSQVRATELLEAKALLDRTVPPSGIAGIGPARARRLGEALEAERDEMGVRLGALLLDLAETVGEVPDGTPCCAEGRLYVLSRTGQLLQLDSDATFRPVGPVLGRSGGLAIGDGRAVVVRQHLFGLEGLGILASLDLRSERVVRTRLRRPEPPKLRQVAEVLRIAIRHGWRSRPAARAFQELAWSAGFLLWSLRVAWVGEGLWVVVESRGANMVELPSGRVVASTARDFLNLTDAVCAGPDRVYLLEGAFEGEGRLLLWRPRDGQVETVLEPLRSRGGLAVDRSRRVLGVALSQLGMVLELPLDEEGNVVGEPKVVAEGLRRPRWITSCEDGSWWMRSGWGVVRVE